MTHRSGGTLRLALVGLAAVVGLVLGGCSSESGGAPAATTASTAPAVTTAPDGGAGLVAPEGFQAVTLVVTLADGSTREWCVWLADTAPLRARGLMAVTDPELGGRAGMVFTFDADTSSGFWMRDTVLPLSIAWYGADGSFVSSTDMDPCPADAAVCPSSKPAGPYRTAIEVPQGRLEQVGLLAGSSVSLGGACTATEAAA